MSVALNKAHRLRSEVGSTNSKSNKFKIAFKIFSTTTIQFHSSPVPDHQSKENSKVNIKFDFDLNHSVGVLYQDLMDTLQPVRVEYLPRLWYKTIMAQFGNHKQTLTDKQVALSAYR